MAKYTINYLKPNGDENVNPDLFKSLKDVKDEIYRLIEQDRIMQGTKIYVFDWNNHGMIKTVYTTVSGLLFERV